MPTHKAAKFATSLIFRIVHHALEEGFIQAGDTCIDPFGGVSLGALPCLLYGINVVHCELEPKFHALAQANVALWTRRYGHLPQWGKAVLLQGDSRELMALLQAQVDLALASPPFCDSLATNIHTLAAFPVMTGTMHRAVGAAPSPSEVPQGYGTTPGNLGNLPPGEIAAVIASPPFSGTEQPCASQTQGLKNYQAFTRGHGTKRDSLHSGETPGQLSAMPRGTTARETFWSAAQTILEHTFQVLRPGGYAIWVTKNYIRAGKIVSFTDDWITLCHAVGFTLRHHHKAMLVEEHGEQRDLFEEPKQMRTERKSFFRRLAEKHNSPRIDWEDVVCMSKPEETTCGGAYALGPQPDEA